MKVLSFSLTPKSAVCKLETLLTTTEAGLLLLLAVSLFPVHFVFRMRMGEDFDEVMKCNEDLSMLLILYSPDTLHPHFFPFSSKYLP